MWKWWITRLLQVTTPISILANVKVANRASSTKQLKFVPRFFCFSSLFLGIAFTIYVILTIIEWGWVWCEELCKSRRMLSAEVGEGGLRDHENTSDNTKAELHNSFIIFLSPLHRSSSKLFLSTVSGHKQMFFLQIQEYFLPILAFIGLQFWWKILVFRFGLSWTPFFSPPIAQAASFSGKYIINQPRFEANIPSNRWHIRRGSTPVSTVLRKSVRFFIINIFLVIKNTCQVETWAICCLRDSKTQERGLKS